ncbi:cuticle protein-like [Topomyia yanbarensis]|uniref:cuticle protein-like n=1 Tax=Topomyia yanbarensis TaxID=2498891 RepID=UPI00273B946E|nr:cuticle protein-like [Topomyia yanbarensis]
MSFKVAVIFAILASVSAGYVGQPSSYAAQLACTSYAAQPAVHLSYASPAQYDYVHSGPISHGYAAAPVVSYAVAPMTKTYATTPALAYSQSYAPALAYNKKSYGYSSYDIPLVAKTYTLAQPAAINTHAAPLFASQPIYGATSYTNSYINHNKAVYSYAH